jgi:hypothetical protein
MYVTYNMTPYPQRRFEINLVSDSLPKTIRNLEKNGNDPSSPYLSLSGVHCCLLPHRQEE